MIYVYCSNHKCVSLKISCALLHFETSVCFKLIILFEKFSCISVSQFLTINISIIQEKFEDTKGAFSSGNSNKKSYNGQKKKGAPEW